MTTLTGLCPPAARAWGFDALLIAVGRRLVRTGERLASRQYPARNHREHEDRLRDGAALRHSGIWI